jgi:hypothetical protein
VAESSSDSDIEVLPGSPPTKNLVGGDDSERCASGKDYVMQTENSTVKPTSPHNVAFDEASQSGGDLEDRINSIIACSRPVMSDDDMILEPPSYEAITNPFRAALK